VLADGDPFAAGLVIDVIVVRHCHRPVSCRIT
jgi:hypothetical protein